MARKITVTVATHSSAFEAYQRPVAVSLPAPPFDLQITAGDRPETMPHSAPIRMDKLSYIDRKWLRGVARIKG